MEKGVNRAKGEAEAENKRLEYLEAEAKKAKKDLKKKLEVEVKALADFLEAKSEVERAKNNYVFSEIDLAEAKEFGTMSGRSLIRDEARDRVYNQIEYAAAEARIKVSIEEDLG